MSRKPRVQRTPEEKWQIVLEGLKSGNVAEACRKYEIAPNLYYRWKDEVEAGATTALGGGSAAAQPDVEQDKRIKHRAVLEALPFGSRGMGLTLTTDNGTQLTSARYVETLHRLGITHRRTAYNHPEGNSYIERFHRSLKEEEVWLNEYQNFDQAAPCRPSVCRFCLLFLVLEHQRRKVLHFGVTEHPSAEWAAQQVVEAFTEREAKPYLIRDRDVINRWGSKRSSPRHEVLGRTHSPSG
jgi:transposase-like protein